MGTPKKLVDDAKAGRIPSDNFGFIDACGEAIADLADRALEATEPITLTPFAVHSRPIAIPLANEGFRAAAAGVLPRPIYEWKGRRDQRGDLIAKGKTDGDQAMETEVGYLRLGRAARGRYSRRALSGTGLRQVPGTGRSGRRLSRCAARTADRQDSARNQDHGAGTGQR